MKTTKKRNKSTADGSSGGSSILNYFSKSSIKKNKQSKTPAHLLQKNRDGAPSSSSVDNDNGLPIKDKSTVKSTSVIGSNTYNNMVDKTHQNLDEVGTPESSSTPETHEPTTPPSPSSNSSCDDDVILNHDDAIDFNERIVIKSSSTESEAQSPTEETPPTNETELTTPPSPPTPDTWIYSVTAQPSIKENDDIANKNSKKRQHSPCRGGNQGGSSNSVEQQTPLCLLESESTQDVSSQQRQDELKQDETTKMNTDTPSTSCTPSTLLASSSVSKSTNNFFRKYSSSSNKKKSSSTKNNNKQQQITTNNKPVKRQKQASSNQLFLDFGQNSFGKQTVCNICGMLRVHGLDEDSQQHDKICKDYKEGVSCMGWKNERSVVTFGKHDRILEVRPDDAQQHKKKVVEVKKIVDIELGFASSSSSSNRIDEDENDDTNMTSYMYISKKRVVGLLKVKRIQRAYELLPPNKEEEKGKGNSSISRSLKPSKALLGVHQIWVHKSHRQRGIASKLVTAARDHLIFGMMIPLELVAFSSPTDEGLVFAKGYTASDTPLIYDIH